MPKALSWSLCVRKSLRRKFGLTVKVQSQNVLTLEGHRARV